MIRKHSRLLRFHRLLTLAAVLLVAFSASSKTQSQAADYLQQGRSLYEQARYAEALPCLDRAIERQPTAEAYELRGLAHFELGQFNEAIQDHSLSLKLAPSKASPYWNRAACYVKIGDSQRAIDDFGRAIMLDPQHADRNYNQRGIQYQLTGDLERAVADFQAAERLNPAYPAYRENRELAEKELSRKQRISAAKAVADKEAADKRQAERIARELARLSGAQAGSESDNQENTAGAPNMNRPVHDKWALIVGISQFKKPELNLRCASKDARDFAAFLIGEANFAPDHVHILTDQEATRGRILSELGDKWLPHQAQPDDLVLLYFSGHGSPAEMDVGGLNYLVAYDTDPDDLFASGVPMQDLVRIIKTRVHSDRVVVMLDACHSGAATAGGKGLQRRNFDVDEIAQGTGQLVISSSQPSERSWECKDAANGVFTKYLIQGLRQHGAGTKLGEAFSYMKDRVQQEVLHDRGVLQTPVLKSKWNGSDLVLSTPLNPPAKDSSAVPASSSR